LLSPNERRIEEFDEAARRGAIMSSAAGFLTSQWNGRTATVDLEVDDAGAQTWTKIGGNLDLGSTGGVFGRGLGGFLALYDGADEIATRAAVILDNVPRHFIDRFCVRFTGEGSITVGLAETDRINWTLDVNPCV
jgi:hypothetical protein